MTGRGIVQMAQLVCSQLFSNHGLSKNLNTRQPNHGGMHVVLSIFLYEPPHKKSNNLHMQTKMQISCAVTVQLISGFPLNG